MVERPGAGDVASMSGAGLYGLRPLIIAAETRRLSRTPSIYHAFWCDSCPSSERPAYLLELAALRLRSSDAQHRDTRNCAWLADLFVDRYIWYRPSSPRDGVEGHSRYGSNDGTMRIRRRRSPAWWS